jgi:hypothetical protein
MKMTRQEFDNTSWHGGVKCALDGNEYDIVSLDFGEALIALDVFGDFEDPKWVRCESVELVK